MGSHNLEQPDVRQRIHEQRIPIPTPTRREQNRVAQRRYRERQKSEKERRQAIKDRSQPRSRVSLPLIKPRPEESTEPSASSIPKSDTTSLAYSLQQCTSKATSRTSGVPNQSCYGVGQTRLNDMLSIVVPTETEITTSQVQPTLGSEILPDSIDPIASLLGLGTQDNDSFDLFNSSTFAATPESDLQNKRHPVIETQLSCYYDQSTLQNMFSNSSLLTGLNSPLYFPDLHANSLQLTRTKTLTACFQNALHLGFDLDRITDPSYGSPFFNPHISATDDHAAITDPSIPPHLRPTLPQILFPHHASIDLLPLPELRARVIQLSVSKVGGFNLMELKKDVYYADGIICWSGPPWDLRSWEAVPWFLNKWKLVVGGEAGELWKNSTWWRRSRGQDD